MTEILEVNGIQIAVTFKKIKTLRIKVARDGSVSVSAPYRLSMSGVKRSVLSKMPWIEHQRLVFKFLAPDPVEERKYNDGEEVPYFGAKVPISLFQGKHNRCILSGGTLFVETVDCQSLACRQAAVENFYRTQLTATLTALIETTEKTTSLKCTGFTIRKMRTRWGSCNTRTKKLNFSLSLCEQPVECVEYVVLHELVHTAIGNHGKDFKAMLTMYMPDWKERKKRMNVGQ